jgi:hypothetical protein
MVSTFNKHHRNFQRPPIAGKIKVPWVPAQLIKSAFRDDFQIAKLLGQPVGCLLA